MSRADRRELERRLREAPLPDEAGAEERAWQLVRAGYAGRAPMPRRAPLRGIAVAAGAAVLALAIGLSPAGAKVADFVGDVVGIGATEPEPGIGRLPAPGELLVEAGDGAWIVRADGSRRRLGDYDEAIWSPHGRYVAATDGRQLVAVDPQGDVRWTITAPRVVRAPRWSGTDVDTRIAYRSGDDLWVVAGDGTGARRLASRVAPRAPAWRPVPDANLGPSRPLHVVAYRTSSGRVRAVDADSGTPVPVRPRDRTALPPLPRGAGASGQSVRGPSGGTAVLRRRDRATALVIRLPGGRGRAIGMPPGPLTGPTWSPDGRWLAVGWPEGDQWLLIRAERPRRIVAYSEITRQFHPGEGGGGEFPRISGWILPER
ncbi:MAG TPA: hypothetical protein VK919_08640 [Solirubrobacterales bacterium]|nr:hypothetical protein [Solirubrobacterales bacterium]